MYWSLRRTLQCITMAAMPSESPQLHRHLRLFDATMLVMGSMIGSSIFVGLSYMAQSVQAPGLLLGLWAFGGLFTMLGAVAFAELAAMFPHTGGQYVYLREAFGSFVAFLFGWTQFLVIQTGTNAAVAIAFAKFLGTLVPKLGEKQILVTIPLGKLLPGALSAHLPAALASPQLNSAQLVACGVIGMLTFVNIRGIREGAAVQNVFTVLKVAALGALIIAGFLRGGDASHFLPLFSTQPGPGAIEAGFLAGLAVALSYALFAYDAWYTVAFVADEVHDTRRTLPRAMLLGCLFVTILYVLTNAVYLLVLNMSEITAVAENRVAVPVAVALFGRIGSTLVIVAILVSTFGCVNGLILGGSRVFYAMAREGLFIRGCAQLSSRKTPAAALIYQGGWSMLLALTGSYQELLPFITFGSALFGGIAVLALYRLRVSRPELPRPYRCWGYPVTPAVYLIICAAFLVYVVQGKPLTTGVGMLLMLSGIPFYAVWKFRATRRTE